MKKPKYELLENRIDSLQTEIEELKKLRQTKLDRIDRRIVDFIKKSGGGLKTKEIAKDLNYSESRMSQRLSSLCKRREIEREDMGRKGTFYYIEDY